MNPHPRQEAWGWYVVLYQFMAAMGAGAYVVGAGASFLGNLDVAWAGALLGAPLVVLGIAFLAAHLGQPLRFWRALARPRSSWMSRSAYILSAFALVAGVRWVGVAFAVDTLESQAVRLPLDAVAGLLGVLAAAEVAFLLGAIRPIPLWNGGLLLPLFLASSIAMGLAAITLVNSPEPVVSAALAIALGVTGVLLVAQLGHALGTDALGASVRLLARGVLAPSFWLGAVGLGLVIPLVCALAYLAGAPDAVALGGASACILGALFLRQGIVFAGVREPLRVLGEEVPPVASRPDS